jgi:hypothetical protein
MIRYTSGFVTRQDSLHVRIRYTSQLVKHACIGTVKQNDFGYPCSKHDVKDSYPSFCLSKY